MTGTLVVLQLNEAASAGPMLKAPSPVAKPPNSEMAGFEAVEPCDDTAALLAERARDDNVCDCTRLVTVVIAINVQQNDRIMLFSNEECAKRATRAWTALAR